MCIASALQNNDNYLYFACYQGYVYTGALERFYLELFRVGTDRLSVCMVSWNLSVQKVTIVVENIMVENYPS